MKSITPKQQLWKHLNFRQQLKFDEALSVLNATAQDDICLGVVAFIRFGIHPEYKNAITQIISELFIIDILFQRDMDLHNLQKEEVVVTKP